MMLRAQKRIAGELLKCSLKRVVFDGERLEEIKEAITKADMRELIKENAIRKKPVRGISKGRTRKARLQRAKGRGKGPGKKKGKPGAANRKKKWRVKTRLQRKFLSELKKKTIITPKTYRNMYLKVKGGFFRSKRHIKLYIEENRLVEKK